MFASSQTLPIPDPVRNYLLLVRGPHYAREYSPAEIITDVVRNQSSAAKPEALTMGPQCARSSCSTALKPTGVMATASMPILRKLLCESPKAQASAMPLERRYTTSAGVRAGAKKPSQGLVTICGKPDSAIVGTSGRNFERLGEVTASTRTLPPCSCGSSSLTGLT